MVIQGCIREFQTRQETEQSAVSGPAPQSTWQIWSFLIEVRDADDAPGARVPVEMRGLALSGLLVNGHEVEVSAPNWRQGQTIFATQVLNRTTGATVTAQTSPPAEMLVYICLGIGAVAVLLWMLASLAMMH
jgi:hypothetical protein